MMSLWMEIFITLAFWCIEFPSKGSFSSKLVEANIMTDHTMPFLLLVGEWVVNLISAEYNHIVLNLVPCLIYLMVNLAFVKVTG
jgi:hypothetical protein